MRKKHSNRIKDLVKKAYNSIAGEFDQTRKVQWLEFHEFLEYVESNVKVLDLGCGNGRVYELLKPKKVNYLGIDNSSGLIEKARVNHSNANFELADMVDLDLPNDSFDVIFSIASFHHIPGRKLCKKAVNEMHRVLKKDGILILTVWNLFQLKYLKCFMKSILSFILHLGLKYAWNDLWVKWGNHPIKRYYHAFLPKELIKYFGRKKWKIEKFYFTRKGNRVKFWRAFNICLILRRK